ncbi:DDB1- and CUL4-associated factor 13 [Psilocybe cubensis]|uniref:Uncharacterized protein n=2 Tax=Psilocybe cubensis TaxID=181762 RepID=A0A8H8CEL7_PSICU|nr:DDB1- and CUL4-associated factor 13 [Psilocybe cubensis]KAH9476189.1 DDB1- and CUL4-associated factor 13 [Psilocybe cubensis]
MERMFAKPLVDSLEGHIDAVEVLYRRPGFLTGVASGSWDGGIILHNLATRKPIAKIPQAHKGKRQGYASLRMVKGFLAAVSIVT